MATVTTSTATARAFELDFEQMGRGRDGETGEPDERGLGFQEDAL